MRILDVSPRPSHQPIRGSAVRAYNLLRHLSARHEVRAFSQLRWPERHPGRWIKEVSEPSSFLEYQYANPIAAGIVEISERSWVRAPVMAGAALRVCRPKLLGQLLGWADVAMVEFPWQFAYCRRTRPDLPLVLASHNVELQKFTSYAEAWGLGKNRRGWLDRIERMERFAAAEAAIIAAVSPADRELFIRLYGVDPGKVIVAANGADTNYYCPVSEDARKENRQRLGLPEKPTMVYVGSNVPPNKVGFDWVRRMAQQMDRFTFLVVGPVCAKAHREGNLIATGPVISFREYQAAADMALCPIQYGGGTKIKLLESLSAGLPTVVFEESVYGTGLKHGEHLLVAGHTTQALIDAANRLANDRELAQRLGRAGREYMVSHYDWSVGSAKLEEAMLRVTGSEG